MGKKKNRIRERGIHVRKLNLVMAAVTIAISVVLLISTLTASNSYKQLFDNTEHYIDWQNSAFNLELASDYLTEQVRLFAMTGDVKYMENYFTEAKVTKRRDKALDDLRSVFEGTEPFKKLQKAMTYSKELMYTEYRAMYLTVEAYDIDKAGLPQEVLAGENELDYELTKAEKRERACSILCDEAYTETKNNIYAGIDECIEGLKNDTSNAGEDALQKLKTIISRQQVLIFVMIAVVVTIVLVTAILLIRPLIKAAEHMRNEQPIPAIGSYEFCYLARTYNLMYEANREKSEHLVYEAVHDKLTDLYNRSGYEFLLKNIEKAHCTFLMIDLDKFKQINDTYGHDTGDRALQKVARALRSSFRSKDYICRIGGDEFVVIMVNASSDIAELVKEKVRKINEELSVPAEDMPPLSISVGIAFGDKDQSLKEADSALYKVKKAGGCGCMIAE